MARKVPRKRRPRSTVPWVVEGIASQVVRRSYAETPPRVEYELTEKGQGLLPVIEAMRQFGHIWLVPHHDHSTSAA